MLISLAVARMITPMIAAYFLKAKGEAKHGEGWLMDRYLDVLRWTLVHRWKTVGIGFVCFVLQIGAFVDAALDLPAEHRRRHRLGSRSRCRRA